MEAKWKQIMRDVTKISLEEAFEMYLECGLYIKDGKLYNPKNISKKPLLTSNQKPCVSPVLDPKILLNEGCIFRCNEIANPDLLFIFSEILLIKT